MLTHHHDITRRTRFCLQSWAYLTYLDQVWAFNQGTEGPSKASASAVDCRLAP